MPSSGAENPASRTNGVLPISVTQQGDKPARGSRGKSKISQDGIKISIRYLPPGLKEFECTSILGDDWRVGGGKVDWLCFEPGRQARTPGKPSRPAIAYIHLTKPEFAAVLGDFVRNTTWEDSGNTYNDPALVFPPFVEKCAFQKIPPLKDRADQRQGTIDTDPDFMAFLEELANPPAPAPGGAEENADAAPAPTVTPLIEYLKAKKANREKESASSKSARSKQDGKSAKSKGADDKKAKDKGDKPKDEVKILKKSSADASKDGQKAAGPSGKAAAAAAASASSSQPASSGEPPKSRRAGIAAAARLLQRDLGLSPGTAHRRARLDAAKAEADTKPSTTANTSTPSTASTSKGAAAPATPAAQPPKDQQATPKSQTSGRSRGRGAKNADKGKGVENNANGSGPTAANPPVLLKKRPEQATTQAPASPAASSASAPTSQKPGGTETAGKASPEKPKPTPSPAAQKKDKPAQVTPGATRGFVKHANPSQGVTEQLLKQALGAYGTVTFVEIDKRKGFAYVDFAGHEGLAKAMAASPVPVAQATVQVLERKDKKPAQGAASGAAAGPSSGPAEKESKERSGHRRRGRRGGGGGGGGGGAEKSAGGSGQGAAGSAAG